MSESETQLSSLVNCPNVYAILRLIPYKINLNVTKIWKLIYTYTVTTKVVTLFWENHSNRYRRRIQSSIFGVGSYLLYDQTVKGENVGLIRTSSVKGNLKWIQPIMHRITVSATFQQKIDNRQTEISHISKRPFSVIIYDERHLHRFYAARKTMDFLPSKITHKCRLGGLVSMTTVCGVTDVYL